MTLNIGTVGPIPTTTYNGPDRLQVNESLRIGLGQVPGHSFLNAYFLCILIVSFIQLHKVDVNLHIEKYSDTQSLLCGKRLRA